jgi:hypothetical protein
MDLSLDGTAIHISRFACLLFVHYKFCVGVKRSGVCFIVYNFNIISEVYTSLLFSSKYIHIYIFSSCFSTLVQQLCEISFFILNIFYFIHC